MTEQSMREHAETFLRAALTHPQCRDGAVEAVGDSAASVVLELEVEMTQQAVAAGESPTGVKRTESVWVSLDETYPWRAPVFFLRPDFPRNLHHLGTAPVGVSPSPCLVDGNVDEFFNGYPLLETGIGALVNQLCLWLARAAKGTLSSPELGWEAIPRNATRHEVICDAGFVRAELTKKPKWFALETIFYRFGDPKQPLSAPAIENIFVTLKSFAAVVAGFKKLPFSVEAGDGFIRGRTVTGFISAGTVKEFADVLPDTVSTIGELEERAAELGCKEQFQAFMTQLRLRLQDITCPHPLPVAVVFCVRRPYALMDRSSDIELIAYCFEVRLGKDRKTLFDPPEANRVIPARQIDELSPSLLRRVSGTRERPPVSLIGCGSVGSKVAFHLARAGVQISVVADNGIMRPHNLARHALLTRFPFPKAQALADALGEICETPHANLRDAGAELADPRSVGRLVPEGTGVIINTTASLVIRERLSGVLVKDMPARAMEVVLFGRGKCAVVFCEGTDRTPNLVDLQAWLTANLTESERQLMFDPLHGLTQVQIGDGCGSLTMPMTDARLSAMTATAAEEVMRLAGDATGNGHIAIGVTGSDGLSTTWRRLTVPPFIEVPVKGGDWTLRLAADVDRRVREDVARHAGVETGGLLVGSCSARLRTVSIVDIIDAPSDSSRSSALFVLGTKGLKSAIAARHVASGGSLFDIGTWHNHLAEQGPSALDMKTAREMAEERSPPAILLIRTPGGYHAVMSQRRA